MTTRAVAVWLHTHVSALPARGAWSTELYPLIMNAGWSRATTGRALKRSGLYPLRNRYGHVWWQVAKPSPWLPDRITGVTPPVRSSTCNCCGHRAMRPEHALPVDMWGG